MSVDTPKDLLIHEMGDLLYAEKLLGKVLPKVRQKVRDDELSKRLDTHIDETKQHVQNLERAFEQLGMKPKAEACPGIEGIRKEYEDFLKEEQPGPEIIDMFTAGAAVTRMEHYEIAGYSSAMQIADVLGETEVVKLLRENLRQEQSMLHDAESIAQRLGRDGGGNGASPRQSGGSSQLEGKTLEELQKMAREKHIKGRSDMNKRELVRALQK